MIYSFKSKETQALAEGKPVRRFRRDGPGSLDDLRDPVGGHPEAPGRFRPTEAQGPHELGFEHISGWNGFYGYGTLHRFRTFQW